MAREEARARLSSDAAAQPSPTCESLRRACGDFVRHDRDGRPGWLINGEKMWTTGMHVATHVMTFARTSGADGDAKGITCFIVLVVVWRHGQPPSPVPATRAPRLMAATMACAGRPSLFVTLSLRTSASVTL